jgi:uncharacterized coiled-coil DUF342 family protein
MNDDVIADLKQFISNTISQQLSLQTDEIRKDIDGIHHDIDGIHKDIDGIRGDIKKLDKKIDDIDQKLDTALEAIGENDQETHKHLKNHERRIKKLETKLA